MDHGRGGFVFAVNRIRTANRDVCLGVAFDINGRFLGMLQVDVLYRDVCCRVAGGVDRDGAVGSDAGIPIGKGRIVISYGIVVLGNGLTAFRSAYNNVAIFHIPGGGIGGR